MVVVVVVVIWCLAVEVEACITFLPMTRPMMVMMIMVVVLGVMMHGGRRSRITVVQSVTTMMKRWWWIMTGSTIKLGKDGRWTVDKKADGDKAMLWV